MGVAKRDTFIWEVTKYDEVIYSKYFSEDPNFIEGVSKKYEITNINEKSSEWEITYDKWDYTKDTDKFAGDPDSDESMIIYKSPEDQAENVYTIDDILNMWIIPTPYVNYLEDFRDHFKNNIINIYVEDDGTLRAKYAFSHIEYDIEIAYTLDGVIETIRYVETDGDVFVVIELHRETALGTNLVLIPIGLIGILSVIYLLIIIKRKVVL
ncbi:MAG: hypothetical protein ACTSR8_07180 [Promethearchaeota archaeon]